MEILRVHAGRTEREIQDLALADQEIKYAYGLTRGPVAVPLT